MLFSKVLIDIYQMGFLKKEENSENVHKYIKFLKQNLSMSGKFSGLFCNVCLYNSIKHFNFKKKQYNFILKNL